MLNALGGLDRSMGAGAFRSLSKFLDVEAMEQIAEGISGYRRKILPFQSAEGRDTTERAA